jgi:hypothetical protein
MLRNKLKVRWHAFGRTSQSIWDLQVERGFSKIRFCRLTVSIADPFGAVYQAARLGARIWVGWSAQTRWIEQRVPAHQGLATRARPTDVHPPSSFTCFADETQMRGTAWI